MILGMTRSAGLLEASEVALETKVAFLSRTESYPDPATLVEAKETHMSWVFLTDAFAYKLKKPVRTDFLDFSTLAARRLNCEREVQLNRRLAADVYLGLTALTVDDRGQLHLDGVGEPIDWLVKMRRLPAWRCLENMIAAGGVHEADIRRLALRLTEFYETAPRLSGDSEDYRRRFETGIRNDRSELVRPAYDLPKRLVDKIASRLQEYVDRHGAELEKRAARVVEGHGDLRPEHVFLTAQPVVTDCLEFNRDFRLRDPADEPAYLAMECDRLGAPLIETWLFDVYRIRTSDEPASGLLLFYKGCNAFQRAAIAIRHLDEPHVRDRSKWIGRTDQYLRLAQKYLGQIS